MRARREDAGDLAELVRLLWPDHTLEELAGIIREYTDSEDSAVFALRADERWAGAALCALRHDYVEGCETNPVGYLEGVVTREDCRRRGIAGRLVAECEQWARDKGCTEFASDCELTNDASLAFHLRMGFREENRIICFKKEL